MNASEIAMSSLRVFISIFPFAFKAEVNVYKLNA